MTEPLNPIEWLMDKVSYESDISKLRNLAIAAVLMIPDGDTVQDVFQAEMEEDGYFDKDTEHVSDSDWLQDVSVGDDISIYRVNNKALVIVRVQ